MEFKLEQDMAGKWRVWVQVGEDTKMFKFQRVPTEAEIQAEIDKIASQPPPPTELDYINAELYRINKLIARKLELERNQ